MSEGTSAVAEAPKGEAVKKRRRMQENAPVEFVPLSRINPDRYSNYRKLSSNDQIESYVDSIFRNGLKQNLVGGIQPDGSIGLSCGFQRFESLERIAVQDVVDEYNKHFGYEPNDLSKYVMLSGETLELNPGGITSWRADTAQMRKSRRRIRETSPEWAKKYDDALAASTWPCQIKTYKSDSEALIDNIEENKLRDDPSLSDETARIVAMLQDGMAAGAVAIAIGKSPATVSHYKRIAELVPTLQGLEQDYLKTTGLHPDSQAPGAAPKVATDEQSAFLRKMAACIAELDRRWKLGEGDPCSLQFQQLRELSNIIDPAKEDKKIPLHVIFDVVAVTVRLNREFEPTNDPSYDQSTFKARTADIVSFYKTKLAEAAKAAEAAAAAASGVAPAAAPAAAPATPALNVDVNKPEDAALLQSMAAATGETVPAAAPAAAQAPPTDAERQARIDQANAQADAASAGHSSDDMIDEADAGDMSTDDLMSSIAVPTVADLEAEAGKVPTAPDDGVMRAKTSEATKSRWTTLSPDKVENLADAMLKDMADPAQAEVVTAYDAVGWMSASKQLYYAIGLSAKSEAVNEKLVEFVEQLGAYMAELEKLAASLPIEQQVKAKTLKPAIPTVVLPQG